MTVKALILSIPLAPEACSGCRDRGQWHRERSASEWGDMTVFGGDSFRSGCRNMTLCASLLQMDVGEHDGLALARERSRLGGHDGKLEIGVSFSMTGHDGLFSGESEDSRFFLKSR